jgi:hypothetical protein
MALSITSAQMAAALNTYINSGGAAKILIKDGTPPANANAAMTGTTLATFTLSNPAFDSTANGVMTLDVTPALTVAASASGTATYFRVTLTNGTTTVLQGTVGVGSGDLQLNTTTITSGVNVSITSGTITVPA